MQRAPITLEIEYHVEEDVEDDERFHQAATWVANQYGIKELSVSISIVDDPTIHRLNREHLQHDWPTDVISFVFSELDSHPVGTVDGEIIASLDTAKKLSEKAGWSTSDELLLYIVHGLLHLAGLDDIAEEDRKVMREREQNCLLALGVAASNHLSRWEDVSY